MKIKINKKNKCIICNSEKLETLLNLGKISIATKFFSKPNTPSPKYPLGVSFCQSCFHIQNSESVDPSIIFNKNYNYYSNSAETFLKHLRNEAKTIKKKFKLNRKSKVLEVASNDGSFQDIMKNISVNVVGVEPSKRQYLIAKTKGFKVYNNFFDNDLIEKNKFNSSFDLVIMRNVISHTPNPLQMLIDGKKSLSKNGAIILETVIQNFNFESPYHGIYSYFSICSLINLATKAGLIISNIKNIKLHGESLRIVLMHPKKSNYSKINNGLIKKVNLKQKTKFNSIVDIKKSYQKLSKQIKIFKKNFNKLCNIAKKKKLKL